MPLSHLPHLSASIQVKTTGAFSLASRHLRASARTESAVEALEAAEVAVRTTSGLCSAFMTSWKVSESSSSAVGRRLWNYYTGRD